METAPHALSVLVVDDDADTADSLADLLALHGYAARAATCGADALALAAADPPDVLVLDIRMPGMDGWELARRFAGARKPPLVVAVSGCGTDADRQRSGEAGVHLHLVKPVEPAVVLGILRRFAEVVSPPICVHEHAAAGGRPNPSEYA